MAKNQQISICGHPSIYKEKERNLNIYFSEPELGVNKDTGILLLIPGFGGNANSNVYKKMRDNFSDRYNMVVVQCDYFGWEFMQGVNNIRLNLTKEDLEKVFTNNEVDYILKDESNYQRLFEVSSNYCINMICYEVLAEDLTNFNDMGVMQAIDNVSAIILLLEIIKDNGYEFNEGKIIAYGDSHGGYLAYLCNAIAPNLLSLIIDNSAWVFPAYLKANRKLNGAIGNSILTTNFDYIAKKIGYDEEFLNLSSLYDKFKNNCNIICYHGTNDNLVSCIDKKKFADNINLFNYNEISESEVDGQVFKSNAHGLDADFLKLYDYTINNLTFEFESDKHIELDDIEIKTNKHNYHINYSKKLPRLSID